MSWFLRCSWCEGPFNGGNCRRCTNVSFRDEFVRNPDPISYHETPDFSYPPPHPQTYSCELCGNDSHYDYDCPPWRMNDVKSHNDMIESRNELFKTMQSLVEMLRQQEQAANLSTHTFEPSRCFNYICYDDDDEEESTIPLNEIFFLNFSSIATTLVLPTMEPDDSLIMRDENLSTIPKKESDEVIKSSVEDFVPIPSKSEDNPTMTSLPEEDVQEENFKTYSNPLFKINEEYISSDINPLYNEVLEDINRENSLLAINEPFLHVDSLVEYSIIYIG
nr:hypothetical protein [Tanacetum cinerariifolium]